MADAELDELKREFLAEALEKIVEIESRLSEAQSRDTVDRLIYLAHQLKGSGGSYGFQRISADAAELEKSLEEIVNGTLCDDTNTQLRGYVGSLRSEIETRTRELGAS
jgi:HPt (histidine-containing phosphotransfer) domain-containing protein